MSLWELLAQNPTTIIAYSIFFAVLAITLPFIGHLGRRFPKLGKDGNFTAAKILAVIAVVGIIMTIAATFLFIKLDIIPGPDFLLIAFIISLILTVTAFLTYIYKKHTNSKSFIVAMGVIITFVVSFLFIWFDIRGLLTFEVFALIAFVIPLVLAPFAALAFYFTKETDGSVLNLFQVEGRTVSRRNAAELFVVYAAFGVVASNFHDILWCGEKTSWFTVTGFNGFELEIWVDIVQANTYDYVFFGFFMLLHVIFCGLIASFFLWRYTRRYGEGLLKNPNSRLAFFLAWIGSLLWGYGLYLMDSSSRQSSVAWMVGTFIWIPLGIFILALSARYLTRFELKLSNLSVN